MLAPPSQRAASTHPVWFLTAALLLHLLAITLAPWLVVSHEETARIQTQPMRVRVIEESASSARAALARARKQERKETQKPREKVVPEKPTEQLPYVYDTVIRPDQPQPKQASVSARQALRVEQETQKKGAPGAQALSMLENQRRPTTAPARPLARSARGTQTERTDASSSPAPPQKNPVQQDAPSTKSSSETQREESPQDEKARTDLVLPERGGEIARGATPDASPLLARKGDERGKSDPSKLFPSASNAGPSASEFGNGGTFNYLEDVEEGERTLLNQKRNRYWTFWDRLVRQVRREWSPIGELRRRDPYGDVYGVKLFYTRVDMVLNGDGSVNRLRIGQSCGVDFLDDEAIRAMNAAAPFPNPPEGLKNEDGQILVRFGFSVDIQSGDFKLFRLNKPEPIF